MGGRAAAVKMTTIRTKVLRVLSRSALVCLGVVIALVGLEVVMRLAGFSIRTAQERRNTLRLQEEHQFRILCLGESTTEGNAGIRRYPDILQEILNEQKLGLSVVVINMGQSGAVTRDIIGDLDQNLDAFQPHMVVSMLGINDGGRTHAYGTIIGPGREKWYGELRVYKLARLMAYKLSPSRGVDADASPAPPALGEGISRQTPTIDEAYMPDRRVPAKPTPVVHRDLELMQTAARLIEEGKRVQARRLLEQRLHLEPPFDAVWVELARMLAHDGDLEGAHEMILQGLEEFGDDSIALNAELALSHVRLGELQLAIETLVELRKRLLRPVDLVDHTHYAGQLADLYEATGQIEAAERTLKEIAEQMNPGQARFYDPLIALMERQNQVGKAARYREIRRRVAEEYFNPETRDNYRMLMETVRRRGIQLVASQYPGRPVEETMRLLDNDPWPIYVDNGFFRELVDTNGYDTYYIDEFAVDFGHLTALGNRLLAESIARAIVEGYFERRYVGPLPGVPVGDLVVGGVTE